MAEGFTHLAEKHNVLCRYFIHGACRRGDRCSFSHERHGPALSNVCTYYQKGNCTYGERCRYDHIRPERLDILRKSIENHSDESLTHSKATGITVPSNKPQDKVKERIEERKFTTLSTMLANSKLCVDAPEFIPRINLSYTPSTNSDTASYATAAGASPSENSSQETEEIIDKKNELCPFFLFSGECRLNEECKYIHGTVCEFCQMACLHPNDEEQRNKHIQECVKDMEVEMEHSFAIARSKEMQCGICMETVWERNLSTSQRFGILPKCSHCFCLDCIRKWRQSKQFENKIIRSCPECRTQSDYIIPSRYWVDDKEKAEKQKLLNNYKSALSAKHCKYFKQGNGECPFGNKCFYLHALNDGTVKDVGPPKKKSVVDHAEIQQYLHNMILWDFLDARDDRMEDIQQSIETVITNRLIDLIPELGSDNDESD